MTAETTDADVTDDTVVRVRNITKSFGGIRAVDDVSFEVRRGEILGVIGPNGCGKTTLFNCILGQYRADGGSVELHGRDVSSWRPHQRSKAGLARTFQQLQVFQSMTVRDNLKTAAQEHIGTMRRPAVPATRPRPRRQDRSARRAIPPRTVWPTSAPPI